MYAQETPFLPRTPGNPGFPKEQECLYSNLHVSCKHNTNGCRLLNLITGDDWTKQGFDREAKKGILVGDKVKLHNDTRKFIMREIAPQLGAVREALSRPTDPTNQVIQANKTQVVMNPTDLLPQNDDAKFWKELEPTKNIPDDKYFLEPGPGFGKNAIGQSLGRTTIQLQNPIIPRRVIGPWLHSTVNADTQRRFFAIDEC